MASGLPDILCSSNGGNSSSSNFVPSASTFPHGVPSASRSPDGAYEAWMNELIQIEAEEALKLEHRQLWMEQGGWPIVEGGGCVGLVNFRNTCWMNAVIQSLAHLEPFTAHFLNPSSACEVVQNPAPPLSDPFKHKVIAKNLRDLLKEMWQERKQKAVNPLRFHTCLTQNAPWVIQRAFRTSQDAQEFFLSILRSLHDELSGVVLPENNSFIFGVSSGCFLATDENLHNEPTQLEEETERTRSPSQVERARSQSPAPIASRNPIEKFFQGQHQTSLTCSVCGYTSSKYEHFFQLSVSVCGDEDTPHYMLFETSLDEALAKEYANFEELSGDNQWYCDKCDRKVNAIMKPRIHKFPPVIVLTLKRFAYTRGGRVRKVNAQVQLSDGGLDSFSFGRYSTLGKGDQPSYSIVSIVNHHGKDAMCGHYTAHCRHPVDGQWYAFNDDKVRPLNTSEVWLPEEAYILCLLRHNFRARSDSMMSFNCG